MYQISTVVPLKLTQCCTSIVSPQERKRFNGKAVLTMVAVGRATVCLWSQLGTVLAPQKSSPEPLHKSFTSIYGSFLDPS